ncbi:hypothetical protein KDM41_14105, partial [bacterium]|nr:hypothetical protein [bacterium]
VELDGLATGGQSWAVAMRGDVVYVALGSADAVAVVDAADPANLSLVKTHALADEGRHIVVADDLAYVALGAGQGFQVLDIGNPTSPVSGVVVAQAGYTAQCVVAGDWIYSALSAGGVGVADRAVPEAPVNGPPVDLDGWVRALAVDGGRLFVAVDAELAVLDLATPGAPAPLAAVPTSGTGLAVAVAGDHAYVGGSFGIDVFDVSGPGAPAFVTNLDPGPGTVFHLAAVGDSLYVSHGTDGLRIVDVSDPAVPVAVGRWPSSEYVYHSRTVGGITFAANGNGGLKALQTDPQGLDPVRNLAVSVDLDPGGEPVLRLRLAAVHTDSVRFACSGDGAAWFDVAADDTWVELDPPLTGLRWRASLVQTGPWPGPVLESVVLTFERLHNHAEITGVADVAGDTGGQVRLSFAASRFDDGGAADPITEYSVYRRFDPALAAVAAPGDVAAAYPPGSWEYLLTLPADREDAYHVVVPTLADGTATAPAWTVFFVRARTATPGLFYDSPPDSGWSINDSAPPPPTGLVVTRLPDRNDLAWQPSTDPAFAHFRVYRLPSPLQVPAPAYLLAVTTGTAWSDPDPGAWFYALTQVNLAGHESPPAATPSAAPDRLVAGARLGPVAPNPCNPATRIAYAVGPGGARVRLDVLDARGRLVATLVDGWRPAGDHHAVWRGRDRAGRDAASGVYTCRLRSGDRVTTRKVTLVR